MKIEETIAKNQAQLMAIPGVVGVGQGESGGAPVILVMVKKLTPQLQRKLPSKLDRFAVKIEETGEVSAF
jgi:hypothetical protein